MEIVTTLCRLLLNTYIETITNRVSFKNIPLLLFKILLDNLTKKYLIPT